MSRIIFELRYLVRYGIPVWLGLLLTNWLPDIGPIIKLRGFVVSVFLPGRPRGLTLGRDLTLLSIHKLRIGSRVYIAKGVWINAIGGLMIEDEVIIAPYAVIATSNHGFSEGSAARGGGHPAPVILGRGSWLAAHAVVTAGVRIGRGNILGANSVATCDTPDDVIIGGVPARVLGPRVDNPGNVFGKHDV